MNILIAVNSDYIRPVKVMLKSLALHTNETLNIYLLYSKLNEKDIAKLSKFCLMECGAYFHSIYVELDIFSEMPLTEWFSIEVYFRLIAPFILPNSIKRILWIDADVIIKKDISNFYYLNMGTAEIAVIRDMGPSKLVLDCCERLGLNKQTKYFNSGIILFNVIGIRKKWVKETFLSQIRTLARNKIILYPDQDILNIIFEKNKIIVSDIWNFQIRCWDKVQPIDIENAAVIHFVGGIKPWNSEYTNKFGRIWWKYYFKCGWKNGYYLTRLKYIYQRYLKKKVNRVRKKVIDSKRNRDGCER